MQELKALIIEDSKDDTTLLVATLQSGGFYPKYEVVATEAELNDALKRGPWDIAFVDFVLPHFSGPGAVLLIRSHSPDLPVIVVSGKMGEDSAVDAMRAGADDYVLKQYLGRLVPAVKRELRDSAARKENREAHIALEEERAKARQYLDIARVVFLVVDLNQKVTLINRMGAFLLGFKEDDVIGRSWFNEFVAQTAREAARSGFQDLLSSNKKPSEYSEYAVTTQSGQDRMMAWHHTVLRGSDHQPTGILSCGEDITELKQVRSQQTLHQAQKLEAIGRLAGGVAHDFNNLITGIRGVTEDLKATLPPEDLRHRDVDAILQASDRAFEVTRQLLAFGRKQIIHPKVLNLNDLIKKVGGILHRLIGEDIHVQLDLGSVAYIKADPGLIEQVLVNLALNARDAMPQGGLITLSTANSVLSKEDLSKGQFDLEPGTYVELRVSDSGPGMDQDTLAHLFEPFFSTKSRDKGSGLGLATVYGTMKQIGGDIIVESVLGQGTTFKVFFPSAEAMVSPEEKEAHSSDAEKGHETVLVIEDEDIVRRVVVNKLRQIGYQVFEAANGPAALEQIKKLPMIDLVISDVIMPVISGPEVIRQIRATHPKVAVLYMSGYPEEIVGSHGVLQPGINFIEKPYLAKDLARKIRETLQSVAKAN